MNTFKSKLFYTAGILSCLSSTLPAFAASFANSQSMTSTFEDQRERQARPVWLYGAIGAGYGSASGREFSNSPDGSAFSLGAVISYKIPEWIFDGGVFWQQVSLSGNLPTGQTLNIDTRAASVELSPRYRFTENFSLGAAATFMFGANTNFTVFNDKTSSALFAGVKAAYEIPGESLNLRVTGSAQTSLTVSDRNVWLINVGLQIGIPLTGPKGEAPVEVVRQDEIETVQAAPAKPIAKPEVRVSLSPKMVYFDTASAKMGTRAKHIIRDIGKFLAQNDKVWGRMEISGHTDYRGSYRYNLKLSDNRSKSVINELAYGGARRVKIKGEAYSYLKPINKGKDPVSLSVNRRVELVFKDVTDANLIESEIKRIVDSYANLPTKASLKHRVTKIPS